MSERLHWKDNGGPICGRAYQMFPRYATAIAKINCRSCIKKLGGMLAVTKHFARLVRDVTKVSR